MNSKESNQFECPLADKEKTLHEPWVIGTPKTWDNSCEKMKIIVKMDQQLLKSISIKVAF